jgi:xanthine dehydrogenase accessory factor
MEDALARFTRWCEKNQVEHAIFEELLAANRERKPAALVTVAAATGSAPRAAGSKMIVYQSGEISGTIGGGKMEALAIEQSNTAMKTGRPILQTYTLREGEPESFGAICGGEVTLFIEPQTLPVGIFLVGAGHCARAISQLAKLCGFYVGVIEDRAEMLAQHSDADERIEAASAGDWIRSRTWNPSDALVIVGRNYRLDEEALSAAVNCTGIGYIGMIGSRRKVARVFDSLREKGVHKEQLQRVFAPIGLDIGADSPAEIAVSVIAEVLAVLRRRPAAHLASSLKTGAESGVHGLRA